MVRHFIIKNFSKKLYLHFNSRVFKLSISPKIFKTKTGAIASLKKFIKAHPEQRRDEWMIQEVELKRTDSQGIQL